MELLLGVFGIGISVVYPVLLVIFLAWIIIKRSTIPIKKTIVRLIVFLGLLLLFVRDTVQTNRFKKEIEGESYTCIVGEFGINYKRTYTTISFKDRDTCELYEFITYNYSASDNQLPGDFIGKYKYHVIHLPFDAYAIYCNKHMYGFVTKKNKPKVFIHDASGVYL